MGTSMKEEFGDSAAVKDFLERGNDEFDGGVGASGDAATMFGDGDNNCNSGSPLEDGLLSDPDCCGMCGEKLVEPRVMSCLHVFCGDCLDKKLVGEAGDSGTPDLAITCPTCKQDTKVGMKKLAALPLDVMKMNVSDVSHVTQLSCTCCTAKEVAISRCSTCHNLLCGNCDSAHRYMRCFEAHKVLSLEELRKNGKKITVHKPLLCETHSSESVVYYCNTCSKSACAECVKTDHKMSAGHQCESILDSELRVRQELETALADGKSKIEQLEKTASDLANSLEELGHQHTTAKDLINESYQSYKAVLEKCRDAAVDELNRLFHERELKVMDMSDKVTKSIDMFEEACAFTASLLENGTVPEIMYLRRVVFDRLRDLIGNSPKPQTTYSVEFHTDFKEFERAMKKVFGFFCTESTPALSAKESASQALVALTAAAAAAVTPLPVNGHVSLPNGCARSITNGSPISVAGSMQSSFEGEVSAAASATTSGGSLSSFAMTQSPPVQAPPAVNAATANLQGFSSIAEYNIAQLATLAESSISNAASPTPPFNLADLLNSDTAYKNLASLAKLGLNADNNVSNGSGMLVRATSPSTLSLNNPIMNGFGGVSSSTSPLLSTPEDIIQDPLNSLVNQAGGGPSVGSVIPRTNKVSPMQIRCKFGQLGASKGQFNSPHGFCLGLEEDIIVADTNNHRIQVFEKTGTFKFQFGIPGKDEGQLWYPRKVAVMRATGKYVVCDRGNERSRMQIFTKNGHFLKKIAIRYIDIVAGLAVTVHGEIVAVDSVSPTVFVISETGDLLRWFDCSDYMREPSDIAIHGKEFYVCDFKGHNVVVFNEDGTFIRRIGYESLTNFPNGIDISDAGDILIGDSHGNRFHVAVFSKDGGLVSEFECPYVKVSRCCGLKITSEGYVVTLAKNNHHVLVLNTLYIL